MNSLIVVAENFQDEEFVYPYYKLNEFSKVTVASSNGQDKFGKYGVPARVNSKFSDINGADYNILVIPGGFECPDRLRIDDECLRVVKECDQAKACIGAICHGPWVLISAGLTKGKKMTSYKAVHVDLENSGATVLRDQDVVVDNNYITAQHYKNSPEFMLQIQSFVNR